VTGRRVSKRDKGKGLRSGRSRFSKARDFYSNSSKLNLDIKQIEAFCFQIIFSEISIEISRRYEPPKNLLI
jgi:hypothetical protein